MKVLLVSSYELGHQPVHVASPAAALRRQGHEVRAIDLSVDQLDPTLVDWAEAVAISVPMHTAKRLGDSLSQEIRRRRPGLPIAHYGLYAAVGDAERRGLADVLIEGEYEPALLEWAGGLGDSGRRADRTRYLGRSEFAIPDRSGLPGLDRYARLEHAGRSVLAGAVETSHGCRHRCRHCPIPVVYDGRIRVVPQEVVLADIDQLVAAGAGHITFGDPDFLNAPPHSLSILERAHSAHPEVTFDLTTKVEHILKHADLWHRLADQNLLFVISAFESVDQATLDILDKGHTVGDMVRAAEIVRGSGVHIRPTWLPFVPWTRLDDLSSLFRFIAEHGLLGATDPIQLSIKLLIPQGSLLQDHPAVVPHLTGYDGAGLTWRWEFSDPEVGLLQKELEAIAAEASECGDEVLPTIEAMWRVVAERTGEDIGSPPTGGVIVPRLTESWFCCAEPTESQTLSLQIGQPRVPDRG